MSTQKVAVITGASQGIGAALVVAYRKLGYAVVANSRSITPSGDPDILAVAGDIADPAVDARVIEQALATFGRVDALINGAGPYHRVSLLEETNEGWHYMFDNNLHPVFYLSKAVIPIMKERKWGRIICFSMANAEQLIAQPQLTAHYITKVGLLVLARSLARLVAPHGITVNAISPGFIDSGSAPKEELEAAAKRIPAGYVGSVEDAVATVRFLLSDEARYVNGANIQLSGAWGI